MAPDDLALNQDKLEALAHKLEAEIAQRDAAEDSITPDNAIGRLTRMEAIPGDGGRRAVPPEARLQALRSALDRVAAGTYGACTRCGSEIPTGRLNIMPEGAHCVGCARRGRQAPPRWRWRPPADARRAHERGERPGPAAA